VDDEPGGPEVVAGLVAEPADDRHPAVLALVLDEYLAAKVVVEMDLVPRSGQVRQALLGRLDPGRIREGAKEGLGAAGVVVEEQDSA
jgi:hypothetical protein